MTQTASPPVRDRAGPPPPPPRRRPLDRRDRPLWMLIPGAVLTALVVLVPLVLVVYMSLTDLDQYTLRHWTEAPFLGLSNYAEALVQSPLLSSVGAMWRTIFKPDGVANGLLAHLGPAGPLWLNGPTSYWVLVAVEAWSAWPFVYLLTLAALQSVTKEVHEAAAIDGARWWAKLTKVILPQIAGPVALSMVISFLHSVNNFSVPYVLFSLPAPASVQVLPLLTYTQSFQSFRFGLSAATAVASLIIVAIPLLVYLRALRLDVGEKEGAR
ncbi:sugar ABC transporter permease [Amycolatopsis sp. NBC_00345]|uniref:carbohydrate ABC transporter permease n=1 Tax=Amycolatopsis sp. NBC_00345 TaxID=2975955 RepID=UPI002E256527